MNLGRSEIASIVLLAVALVSAGVVFATRMAPTTEETSGRRNHLLPVWRKQEIAGFSLTREKEPIQLERRGENWFLKTPVAERADDAAVDRLLDGIGFATLVRRITSEDRTRLGLASPRAKLVLGMGDKRYNLTLGAEAPAPAGGAYVEVEAGEGAPTTGVVTREVAALLLVLADDFRRRGLVGFGTRELAELTVERPNGTLRLVRGKGVAFLLDGHELADRDCSDPLFSAVSALSATRFLDVAGAERARGSTPFLSVRLKPTDTKKKTEVIELGGACPEGSAEVIAIVRAPEPRAACVTKEAPSFLSVERDVLVATAPFVARKDEVESLALERGDLRLVMTRRGNGFVLQKPSEAVVDLETGNQRLESILRAQAGIVQNPDLKGLGLDPPSGRAVVTLIGDDDKATEEAIALGRVQADGTLAVRREHDGKVLLLGREAARSFAIDSTLLRGRKVLDFALSALVELELSQPEHQRLLRAQSGFELALPSGFQHDGELATQAVLALGSLSALRFVADQDDGSFGFDKPTLTAKFRIDAGDAGVNEKTLVVGRSSSGGYFAKLAGTAGVFLLERAVAERLSVLLIHRGIFLGDPASLRRLTFTAGAKRIELERQAGELVPAAGSPVDRAALAPALEALGSLRAEAAVHTGPARSSEGFSEPALRVTLEPSPGLGQARSFRVGKSDSYLGQPVRFARADGVEATFVISEAKLRPMFDLF